jgi:hypothetical protein
MSKTEDLGLGPGGYERIVDHGSNIQTLWYADGRIKFRHICRLIDGTRRVLAPETFGPEHKAHAMVSRDPLTLSPSLLCRQCGLHGWIRNGRWEAA